MGINFDKFINGLDDQLWEPFVVDDTEAIAVVRNNEQNAIFDIEYGTGKSIKSPKVKLTKNCFSKVF